MLPGPSDLETTFQPGRAYVRRVPRNNLWIWYRVNVSYVEILTVRDQPPVPIDDE